MGLSTGLASTAATKSSTVSMPWSTRSWAACSMTSPLSGAPGLVFAGFTLSATVSAHTRGPPTAENDCGRAPAPSPWPRTARYRLMTHHRRIVPPRRVDRVDDAQREAVRVPVRCDPRVHVGEVVSAVGDQGVDLGLGPRLSSGVCGRRVGSADPLYGGRGDTWRRSSRECGIGEMPQ